MKRTQTIWTCSRCKNETATGTGGSPSGWGGLARNVLAPDGSWDHVGWKRLHLCEECDDAFDAWMHDAPKATR